MEDPALETIDDRRQVGVAEVVLLMVIVAVLLLDITIERRWPRAVSSSKPARCRDRSRDAERLGTKLLT